MQTATDFQTFCPRSEAYSASKSFGVTPLLALRAPNRSLKHWAIPLATIVFLYPSLAFARVKLITLPVRERVEIQLDNPGATLVEEERIVPLVKGDNQVDFSWANTQIDPNTIVFRVVGPAAGAAARGECPLRELPTERGRARMDSQRERIRFGTCAN